VCIFMGYGLFFSALQANTIADAWNYAYQVPTHYAGLVMAVLAGLIIVGGLRSIARFAEFVVPFMGITYVLIALVLVAINISLVPEMLLKIVSSAFGLQEAGAGALGAAIQAGIQRGLYSNEAGAGSAPQAAASATPTPNHPATQGYVQMLGVFFDTIVLCTCTAILILLAGGATSGEIEGIRLTQTAMETHLGDYGIHFVTIAISFFAFTSVVANYAYAESNLRIFGMDNKLGRIAYTVAYMAMVIWGTNAGLAEVWNAGDMALGLMTLVNVSALILLTPTIVAVSKDYARKRKNGLAIDFKIDDCEIQGQTRDDIWH